MILLWHEGALGDLLLSRVAPAVLEGEIVLAARSEARVLFREAGLVSAVYPASLSLLERFDPAAVYLFASRVWWPEEIVQRFGARLKLLPTRPRQGKHLSREILAALGRRDFPPKARVLLKERAVEPGLIVLHPGSGGRYKCAPPRLFRELYFALEDAGFRPEIILGPAEEGLEKNFSGLRLLVPRTFRETVERLKAARALLGHDSGLSHLAAALGCPTLCLFGPTDWRSWSPFGESVLVLVKECRCLGRTDPRRCQAPCLGEIKTEQLTELAFSWLSGEELGNPTPLPGQRVFFL